MEHFRGGSKFHKYKSFLAHDQSQIIFASIKATKCVNMPIHVFLQQLLYLKPLKTQLIQVLFFL